MYKQNWMNNTLTRVCVRARVRARGGTGTMENTQTTMQCGATRLERGSEHMRCNLIQLAPTATAKHKW